MAELHYTFAEVGSMVLQRAERAKFIVLVGSGPPATLRMVRVVDGEISITDHPLKWYGLHSSFSRETYLFDLVDGTEYLFDPLGCVCGSGRIAYANPAPGFELVRVRSPDWFAQ